MMPYTPMTGAGCRGGGGPGLAADLAILQWSAEFSRPDAMRHAEDMATPWFGINQGCYDAIWTELRQTWHESALIPACQALDIPVLIIDGADDLRPRWVVDSLEHALPDVTRHILPAGHIPWLEVPAQFGGLLRDYPRGHQRGPLPSSDRGNGPQ